jgi:hypothetical protein
VIYITDVRIKTPNLDEIFEKWKQRSIRKDKKKMEKQFSIGASSDFYEEIILRYCTD